MSDELLPGTLCTWRGWPDFGGVFFIVIASVERHTDGDDSSYLTLMSMKGKELKLQTCLRKWLKPIEDDDE